MSASVSSENVRVRPRLMRHSTQRKLVDGILLGIPLIIMFIFIIGPFLWTLSTSLKFEHHITVRPVYLIPPEITFSNYIHAWNTLNFNALFINSFIVSSLSMVFVVIISVLVSYALTRFRFVGRDATLLVMLGTQFLPTSMLIIPLFLIFLQLGLFNTLTSVILAVITFQFPYNTVLMRGFMSGIPVEIEEAAMIDGCSRLQSIAHVVLPILVPGMIAAGSFAFVSAWREFLFTRMFITDVSRHTLSVGLSFMLNEFRVAFGYIAAGCMIAILPPVLVFCYIQRFLVTGLASGAVKG